MSVETRDGGLLKYNISDVARVGKDTYGNTIIQLSQARFYELIVVI